MKNRNRLLRRHSSPSAMLQILFDCCTTAVILYILTLYKNDVFTIEYKIFLILAILVMTIVYQYTGQYSHNKSMISRLKTWCYIIAILLFIGFTTKSIEDYSREVLITWSITALISQYLNAYILHLLQSKKEKSNALTIGNSQTMKALTQSVNQNDWLDYKIIGYVDNEEPTDAKDTLNYLGSTSEENINALIEKHAIKHIYITFPNHQLSSLENIYKCYMLRNVSIHWVPDIHSMPLINPNVKEISGIPIITLSESPLIGNKLLFKSIFDITLSALALIILSPLFLIIALLIKLTSPGPVLFCQKRHGWNNHVFDIYKFRSMKIHTEEKDILTQATLGDTRITKIGRFIRKTSIDELPQLLNVLKGDMSLVGPRPHAISHNNHYQKKIDNYLARHKIKPGMTGWAQITGYRGETDTLNKMVGRVTQDMVYINNWSIMVDIEILIKTVFTLCSKESY